MATYQAEILLKNPGNYFTVTVDAGAVYEARQNIQHIYNPVSIRNLHEVRKGSTSSSDGEGSDGTVAFVFLCLGIWAFISFTPIILMGVSGALGTWIGEKVSRQSISEYNEREDDAGHGKAAFVFVLALIMGGFGFVKGVEIKNYFDAPTTPPSEIKPK